MNEIIKAMEERRSIRKFKPDMPTKEDLEQIIEAGLYAANGMGKQATITIAVTNKNFETDYQQSMQRQVVGKKESGKELVIVPLVMLMANSPNPQREKTIGCFGWIDNSKFAELTIYHFIKVR